MLKCVGLFVANFAPGSAACSRHRVFGQGPPTETHRRPTEELRAPCNVRDARLHPRSPCQRRSTPVAFPIFFSNSSFCNRRYSEMSLLAKQTALPSRQALPLTGRCQGFVILHNITFLRLTTSAAFNLSLEAGCNENKCTARTPPSAAVQESGRQVGQQSPGSMVPHNQ